MRTLLTLILAVNLLVFPFHKLSLVEGTLQSLVKVTFDLGDENIHICTGFKVNPVSILTAAHCVPPDHGEVYVDGVARQIVRQDEAFILLAVPQSPVPALTIRTKPLLLTERVLAFGYGYGVMEVLGRSVSGQSKGDILLDGPLIGGMSGGPIVDLDGKVVGMTQASSDLISLGCGQDEIQAFLFGPVARRPTPNPLTER